MKSFKEFYEETILEEAFNLKGIIGKVLSSLKKKEETKGDPDLLKKGQEAREKLYRALASYRTEVRPAKPQYFLNPDESPIYGPNDVIPPREHGTKNKQLRKLKTPEQREKRREQRDRKFERENMTYGVGSFHSAPFDPKENPYISLARSDAEQIGAHKPIDVELKELFILAHEAGHAFQYGQLSQNPNQINQDLEEGMASIKIPQRDMNVVDYLKMMEHFANAYMELKAWERGGEYIPKELKDDYYNFAKSAYMSYMKKRHEREYLAQPAIKNLLRQFDYHRYDESTNTKGKLLEEKFTYTPRKFLKVHTDIGKLPRKVPYGFWVDRSGNFVPVKFLGHADSARDIIRRAKEWNKQENKKSKGQVPLEDWGGNVKDLMYNDGWIRTRYSPHEGMMYYTTGGRVKRPTVSQQKFLDAMSVKYGIDSEVDPFNE